MAAPVMADLRSNGGAQGRPQYRRRYGKSRIIDYRGNVISQCFGGESYVAMIINIEELRDFWWQRFMTQFC